MQDQRVTFTIPGEIAERLAESCRESGVTRDDAISAILLYWWNRTTVDGVSEQRFFESLREWKSGDRTIPGWVQLGTPMAG